MTGHKSWSAIKAERLDGETEDLAERRALGIRRTLWQRIATFWRWKVYHKLWVPRPWVRARWRWHRSKHGWAACDWWSFDDYICELIGQCLTDFRDRGHAYPGDGVEGGRTPEEWAETLTKIIDPLLAYKTHWDWPDDVTVDQKWEHEKKIIAEAQDALRLMADHLPALWD